MPSSRSSIDKRDVYYRKGKSAGYRARSAYKLLHLDEEFDLFSGVRTAVDLCAAPGSWSQVLGQKLRPTKEDGGVKVVSVDLQPMAPLPNISILQTDITLPSTIPLVLDALGGRKADLVVCDGAPDVTGVHDLDAYLHSQLLLAALTLSLTLLAPHSTLIFKIFLSPMDPQAEMLRSQLQPFFPGPSGGPSAYDEFDANEAEQDGEESEEVEAREQDEEMPERCQAGPSSVGQEGFDSLGRRGGVWVRKPRSSRKGSGEAFLVCRNFDPRSVPLPPTFPPSALQELAKQTKGTLTLESLAHLVDDGNSQAASREWEAIKAYIGSGDLNVIELNSQPSTRANSRSVNPDIPTTTAPVPFPKLNTMSSLSPRNSLGGSSPAGLRINISPSTAIPPRSTTSATANPARRAIESVSSRQLSIDSLTPPSSSSPTQSAYTFDKPWDRKAPSPLPSPIIMQQSAPSPFDTLVVNRDREREVRSSMPAGDGAVSPALSSSSKTDLFFASKPDELPTPPRPLGRSGSIGQGHPSTRIRDRDSNVRSVSTPTPGSTPNREGTDTRSKAFFATPSIGSGLPKSVINHRLTASASSKWDSPASRVFSGGSIPMEPLGTLPTQPDLAIASPTSPLDANMDMKHGTAPIRRESQQLEREQREIDVEAIPLNEGEVLTPEVEDGEMLPGRRSSGSGEVDRNQSTWRTNTMSNCSWRLEKKIGEGAFSSVWSAVPLHISSTTSSYSLSTDIQMSSSTDGSNDAKSRPTSINSSSNMLAAIKILSRSTCTANARTRISFLREVEVLRAISHPNVVGYYTSFSTATHHCLVLERLEGGELFELISDEGNRARMMLAPPNTPSGQGQGVGVTQNGYRDPTEGMGAGAEPVADGEGFVRRLFADLCKGVGFLHEQGVVHRDIKLENLLLTINPFTLPPTSINSIPLDLLPTPLLKISDFGLSRFISPSAPLLTTRCGSESFAAPEIIMGRSYDGRETDAWACGVVLYALIVGELPFDRPPAGSVFNNPGSSNQPSPNPNASPYPNGSHSYSSDTHERNRPRSDSETSNERRKRMMRIAKGSYTWPEGIGSDGVRALVKGLLTREPGRRMRVRDIWGERWMWAGD